MKIKLPSDPNEGFKFVKDVLSTFGDPQLIANLQIELGWLQLKEKGTMGTKPIGTGSQFWSLTMGEWNVGHAGIANGALATLDETNGISIKDLCLTVGQQIIDLTEGYYFDFVESKPKPYVFQLAKKVVKKLVKYGIVEVRDKKYYRTPIDSVDFVAHLYGRAFNCPTGRSSFYRMMVGSVIGETPGIDKTFVAERLNLRHGVSGVDQRRHVTKTLNIHGGDGTGYILSAIDDTLYRVYQRLSHAPSGAPSILQENPDLMNVILKAPCISKKIIYELFGPEVATRLMHETESLKPNLANHTVLRVGDKFLAGMHVYALKQRHSKRINLDPQTNPMLTMIKELYESFSSKDCIVVAMVARDVLHELIANGEFRATAPHERRVLGFLKRRGIVEPDLLDNDKWFPKNRALAQTLSITLGNLLD